MLRLVSYCVHAIAITPAGPIELVRSSISIVHNCREARSIASSCSILLALQSRWAPVVCMGGRHVLQFLSIEQPNNQREFNGEICIHFPGLKGLNKPLVWVFPKVLVSLDCGFAGFPVPERELSVLVKGTAVEGVVFLDEQVHRRKRTGSRSPGIDG